MTLPVRSALRAHWTFPRELTFLNHGSFGACPDAVIREQSRLRASLERNPMAFYYEESPLLWRQSLHALSAFLNADTEGMTFQSNATMGLATVLRYLPLAENDEVLISDHAYAAFRNAVDRACRSSGARPVVVPIPFRIESDEGIVALFEEAISPRSRYAVVETVTSPTAIRMPFERLTTVLQRAGIDVIIDAAHGPGLVPLDITTLGAAYVVGNCHKWLCTPKGCGFLHIRNDRCGGMEPLIISHGYGGRANGVATFRQEFDWQGTLDTTPWLTIPNAIDVVGAMLPNGWSEVMERSNKLAQYARVNLGARLGMENVTPSGLMAGMVSAALPPQSIPASGPAFQVDPLMRRLFDDYRIQVIVFPWPSHGARYLRVSTPLYASETEIDFLGSALDTIMSDIKDLT